MTPSEAVALLEAHREAWPDWVTGVGCGGFVFVCTALGAVLVNISDDWNPSGPSHRRARVRPGLPDEENARRILAAAEKGYRQRLRQAEKQRQRKPMKRAKFKRPHPKNIRSASMHIKRKTKLKPVRRDRKARRFEEDFGGEDRVLWGKSRPCDTCGAPPPSQNSHVLSRNGRLGKAREVISQCQECHDQVYEMDTPELLEIAARVYQQWLDQGGHELPSGLERHGESR